MGITDVVATAMETLVMATLVMEFMAMGITLTGIVDTGTTTTATAAMAVMVTATMGLGTTATVIIAVGMAGLILLIGGGMWMFENPSSRMHIACGTTDPLIGSEDLLHLLHHGVTRAGRPRLEAAITLDLALQVGNLSNVINCLPTGFASFFPPI